MFPIKGGFHQFLSQKGTNQLKLASLPLTDAKGLSAVLIFCDPSARTAGQ